MNLACKALFYGMLKEAALKSLLTELDLREARQQLFVRLFAVVIEGSDRLHCSCKRIVIALALQEPAAGLNILVGLYPSIFYPHKKFRPAAQQSGIRLSIDFGFLPVCPIGRPLC